MKFLIITVYKNKRSLLIRVASWIVVVVYLLCIFLFSNQTGAQSNRMSEHIVKEIGENVTLPQLLQQNNIVKVLDYNFLLRKFTHFIEYFALAIMVFWSLNICGIRARIAIVITLAFCIVYACLDEYHQSFVLGRTPSLRDIAIDVSGGLLAIAVTKLMRNIIFSRKQRV